MNSVTEKRGRWQPDTSGRDREDEETSKCTEAMGVMELDENEGEGDSGEAPMDLDD